MTDQAHILMCAPEYFGIHYQINPWMDRARRADPALADAQWQALRRILTELGARVSLLPPVAGLPDLVFTANAALIYRDRAILSRFRHPQRQGEEAHDGRWLSEQGFGVERLDEPFRFEGAGDALFCGDTLYAGYRIRSEAAGLQRVAAMVGHRVIPLELVAPHFYHLDTCFCPLEAGTALYYPAAFDEYGRRVLNEFIENLIEVEPAEAEAFACNAVVVGRHVVTNTGCPSLHRVLRERGFEPIETPLGEFLKAGGSAKCLTLRLDGEEAAAWKSEMPKSPGPSESPGPPSAGPPGSF